MMPGSEGRMPTGQKRALEFVMCIDTIWAVMGKRSGIHGVELRDSGLT